MDRTEKGRLAIIQCGAFKYIGTLEYHETEDFYSNGYETILYQVGALLISRAVMPGTLQGTANMVKEVTITNLDFCRVPTSKMQIFNMDNLYYVDDLDETDAKVVKESYNNFLKGNECGVRAITPMKI